MIKLPFAGIKGQTDSRPIQVQVPCMEMYGKTCPVLTEVRPWFKDKSMEDMGRKYWKKKSYIFQGFVVTNPLNEDTVPENPIRRFIIGPQIFNIIRSALLDPEMEELPTDYVKGVDFRINKTTKGGYADYSTSLSDYRPKEPSEAEIKIIKELFEKSVDGEAYDLEKYGQYFRPAGVSYQAGSQVSVPKADRPVAVEKTANPVNAEVKETTAPAPTAQPSGDSAKRAEDILKLIRSRQQK